jgi:hypothetical protein
LVFRSRQQKNMTILIRNQGFARPGPVVVRRPARRVPIDFTELSKLALMVSDAAVWMYVSTSLVALVA